MGHVEKLSVALTPEMAETVRRAVNTGEYASASEVIREALREWNIKRESKQQHVEELRRLWQEGLESGPGRYKDIETIRREAWRRKRSKPEAGA